MIATEFARRDFLMEMFTDNPFAIAIFGLLFIFGIVAFCGGPLPTPGKAETDALEAEIATLERTKKALT
jgi:hypothetical protein